MYKEELNSENMKLKLSTRKLKSGNFQVKFEVSNEEVEHCYGYVLAKPGTTLKHVVGSIQQKILTQEARGDAPYVHLFSLDRRPRKMDDILIFND